MTHPKKILNAKEQLAWLRLCRTKSVGPKTFDQLLMVHGTPEKALEALPDMARKGGRKTPLTPFSKSAAQKELDALHAFGGELIAKGDKRYPTLLSHIADAPPVISVKGNVDLLKKNSVAFVGARNSSINGKKLTHSIAQELGNTDYVVTSGLARGIDTAAHQGSLATGTIAVVAGGIDVIYPKENAALYDQIAEQGLIIAELPFGTGLRAEQFPRRNRIVSGLSRGVVVVEAARRSGSLITARQALEQGREVMAFPGTPLDPRAEGPNSLIQQGATLVTNAQDIIGAISSYTTNDHLLFEKDETPYITPDIQATNEQHLAEIRETLPSIIGYNPVSVDDLVIECGASINIILTCLLELELADRLERHPGNKVSLLAQEELFEA